MSRLYNSRLVALTTGLNEKWLDNLLSHFAVPGVTSGRQGVRRDINDDGLLAIEVIRVLVQTLGASLENAVDLSRRAILFRSQLEARVSAGPDLTLVLNLDSIEQRLREQMVHAVESMAQVRRGRPSAISRSRLED